MAFEGFAIRQELLDERGRPKVEASEKKPLKGLWV